MFRRSVLISTLIFSLNIVQEAHSSQPLQSSECHVTWTTAPQIRTVCIAAASFDQDVCIALGDFAQAWGVPQGLFARLIWQESRFDRYANSPAGAQGIAQFMPGTARLRKLANPYNPVEALARSAEYIHFLDTKFGNFGLAAAAYNAGEGRTARFLASGGNMPIETENYVSIVTGKYLGEWVAGVSHDPEFALSKDKSFREGCLALAANKTINNYEFEHGPYQPWGVQVSASFRPNVAQRAYANLQTRHPEILGLEAAMIVVRRNRHFGKALRYHAIIGRPTEGEARDTCLALQRIGTSCVVVRN